MAFKTVILLMATVLLVLETSWVSSKNDKETPLLPSMHTSSKVAASKTPSLSVLPPKPLRKRRKKPPPPPPPSSTPSTSPGRTPPPPPPPPPSPPADVEPSPDAES